MIEQSSVRTYLERVLLLHRYTGAPAGIGLGRADVAGEVARDDRYLHRLVLDRGDVLHRRARRSLGVGRRRALREARLPDVRRLRRHSGARTWLLPDAAARAGLRGEVYSYVHEDHDAGWDVEAAEGGIKNIADVLRQLKQRPAISSQIFRVMLSV